jgi:Aerobic-type carbon monoxide dehydrogenase, large subunit CoxL/CutL homologs
MSAARRDADRLISSGELSRKNDPDGLDSTHSSLDAENSSCVEFEVEPERYELSASPIYRFELDRREFFKLFGAGMVVLLFADFAVAQPESGGGRRRAGNADHPSDIHAWLHIGEDDVITVFTGKTEVGQNIRTSLTQAVAEELPCKIESIRFVMADTDVVPFDRGTFGSRTTPDMGFQLRRVAAEAREALLDLAADQLKVERSTLRISEGRIVRDDSTESISFGQLTKGQKLVRSVSNQTLLKPAGDWKIAGTSLPKISGREFVTGKHLYTSDIHREGMLHGKVLRPSALQATLGSLDVQKAEAMRSVKVVRDGNFVGVAADDPLLAVRALDAIQVEWITKPQISNAELYNHLRKTGGGSPFVESSPDELKFHEGELKLRRTYRIAYIAHAPLEPRAAVAEWNEGKLTVWTGTQRPFGVRSELARAFGIPESQVRVIVPDTGSGYGGKHTGEAAIEAARLAKGAGKPVKVVWTREEEFMWAYFRPAGVIDVSSTVRKDGTISAWEFHNYNSGNSGIRCPYDVPGARTEFHNSESPLRQGSYRGLASAANIFAYEVHVDELAELVKMDPLKFRLKNLKDARLRAVLETAAERFGWGKSKPGEGRGFGIACGVEKGGYVATCAEVVADRQSGAVHVSRIVAAFECGAVVNPEHLKNQIEGAIGQGIGGALLEEIDFENGRILNGRFSEYRVPRFSDVPEIDVVLVNRKDIPSAGAGETPIVGIAPAISNAIHQATGERRRSLPMVPDRSRA